MSEVSDKMKNREIDFLLNHEMSRNLIAVKYQKFELK